MRFFFEKETIGKFFFEILWQPLALALVYTSTPPSVCWGVE